MAPEDPTEAGKVSIAPSFKYDVAISFMSRDEPLATEIDDVLRKRYRTFFFPRKQEVMAGSDGETTLAKAFGSESRVVVVLHRTGWGTTPFTRIEETAIKNRAFDAGYDFALFVPLDGGRSVPVYLPKPRIWLDLERFRISGLEAVVAHMLHERGADAREETIAQKALRQKQEAAFEKERQNWNRTFEAVKAADAQALAIIDEVEKHATAIGRTFKKMQHQAVVSGLHRWLGIGWTRHFANDLDGAGLELTIWNGHPPYPGIHHWRDEPPNCRLSERLVYDLVAADRELWVHVGSKRQMTNAQVAEYAMHLLMDNDQR